MNLVFFILLLAVQVADDRHNTLLSLFQLYSSCFSFGGYSFQILSALGGSFSQGTTFVAVMLQRLTIPADYLATIFVEVAERLVVLWTEDRDSSQVWIALQLCN